MFSVNNVIIDVKAFFIFIICICMLLADILLFILKNEGRKMISLNELLKHTHYTLNAIQMFHDCYEFVVHSARSMIIIK